MIHRLLLFLTALGLLLYGCASHKTWEELEAEYGPNSPEITKYGAVDRLRLGDVWKVYVAAEDLDGDMDVIEFDLHQPGQGWYTSHRRRLQGEESKAFSGYFFLNTPRRVWSLRYLTLTLKFEIRDKGGHKSEVINLPLTLVGHTVEQPIPAGFTEEENRPLGPILIQLYNEDESEGRRRGGVGVGVGW